MRWWVAVLLLSCGDNLHLPDAGFTRDAPHAIDAPPAVDAIAMLDAAIDATANGAMLLISPVAHDYGSVGAATGPYPTFTFTISNSGSGTASGLGLALGGTNATDFMLGTTTCGSSLAAAASCTIAVTAHPANAGAKAAALVATSGTDAATASLTMAALTGITGLTVDPDPKDFGMVAVGQTALQTFTVTNTGATTTGTITVTRAGASAEFAIVSDGCSGLTLANAATCAFGVTFSPTATGAASASIMVVATPGGTVSTGVTGTGT